MHTKRFGLIAALLGLVLGLAEAAFLCAKPLPVVFLEPDVQYPIWFIAPLAGVVLLGLIGIVMGAVADYLRPRYPWTIAYLAALGGGIVALYAGAVLRLLHGGGGGLLAALANGPTWICFLSGWVIIFAILKGSPKSETFLCRRDGTVIFRCLPPSLVIGLTICLSGLALSAIHRSTSHLSKGRENERGGSPNIVLITLDTVRADHLSAYGYARPTTPHLDSLSQKGVLFENAVAPSSWTLASHASIFTGVLPHQHGANQAAPLQPGPLTVAMVLASRGYETAGFSNNISYGFAGWGMRQGFESYDDDSSSFRHNLAKTIAGQDLIQPAYHQAVAFDDFDRRTAEELNDDVRRWFERRSGRPYFLFINYYDAHLSYRAPKPFDHRFGHPSRAVIRETYLSRDGRLSRPLTPLEQSSLIAGYDNCLSYLDEQVGKLVSMVAMLSNLSNTIVVITSDHGEAFGEHGRYGHGWDLSREVLHVPLIIFGPGIPSGLRIRHLAQIRDLLATIVDLWGGDPVAQRFSLRRFWTPGYVPDSFDDMAISEFITVSPEFRPALISLITSQWHFVRDSDGYEELYDWERDPQEQHNLALDPAHATTIGRLRAEMVDGVGSSILPWRGPEYLGALDTPGFTFAHHALFALRNRGNAPQSRQRIGDMQAHLAQGSPRRPRRIEPLEEEIIRSLPYQ